MNLVEPISQEMVNSSMSSTAPFTFTLFLGAALGGFYLYDLVQRWQKTEDRVNQLDQKVLDAAAFQEAQAEITEEHEQRIREKKDYDESDEIQEDKYQAWKGEYYEGPQTKLEVSLVRKKLSTVKENQQWVAWDGESNGSVIARDYYLGNLHPEFQWEIREGEHYYTTVVNERFVEGWDTVIQLDIFMTFSSQESLVKFTENQYFNGAPTMNLALKKFLEMNSIEWQRVLIDAR